MPAADELRVEGAEFGGETPARAGERRCGGAEELGRPRLLEDASLGRRAIRGRRLRNQGLGEVIPGDGGDDRVDARVGGAEHESERATIGSTGHADDRVAVALFDLGATAKDIHEPTRVGDLVVEGVEGDPAAGVTESARRVGHHHVAVAAHPLGFTGDRAFGPPEPVGQEHCRSRIGRGGQVQVDVDADGRVRSRSRWHLDTEALRRPCLLHGCRGRSHRTGEDDEHDHRADRGPPSAGAGVAHGFVLRVTG